MPNEEQMNTDNIIDEKVDDIKHEKMVEELEQQVIPKQIDALEDVEQLEPDVDDYEDQMTETLGQANNSPKVLTLALAVTDNGANQIVGGGGGDADSCLVTVSDDWIVTSFAVAGTSAQAGNLT